jgi:hypothetical protein
MSICSVCGHENTFGTLVCMQCFTLLKRSSQALEALDTPQWQEQTGTAPEALRAVVRRATRQFSPLASDTIAFYIEQNDIPLICRLGTEILLGRHSESGTSQPHVDLSSYNAYGKGISRLHAAIRRREHHVFIEDLGSTNGSWLNNARLMPFAPRLLQPGDVIQLSQLQITVYFS